MGKEYSIIDMIAELREKALKLIPQLECMQAGNEKRKLKILNQLKKAIVETETNALLKLSDDIQVFVKHQELGNCYVRADNYIRENGEETFESLLMSAPKGQLMKLFIRFEKSFSDEEYWDNLGYIYTIQDYEYNNYDLYKELFSSTRAGKDKLMSPEDFNFYTSLPDQITIYRGGGIQEPEKGYGISWTLNMHIAEKFVRIKKHLSDEQMVVHRLVIQKSKATAYLNNRNEEEIIYIND
jgi:hypothetical protein